MAAGPSGPWGQAAALPTLVAPAWREAGPWQALGAAHAAGERYLALPGFVEEGAVATLRAEVLALSWSRLSTDLVRADRHLLEAHEVGLWLDLLQHVAMRALVGAVLGRAMPEGLVVNAWRLGRGDRMGVHPDGRLYQGTLSLGLAEAWSDADGGAIAFGEPTAAGFEVRQRWHPRSGDACLFAPDVDTFHCVEPVTARRPRHSLTGWWVEPEHGLTRGRGP
jgi:hypothetical protein